MVATIGAVTLLLWRQRRSPAAKAIAELRHLLEESQVGNPRPPVESSGSRASLP